MPMWYYVRGGQQVGPVSTEQLRQMLGAGQVSPQDLVWYEGMAEWQPAGTIADLTSPGSSGPAPTGPGAAPAQPTYAQPLGYQTPQPPQRDPSKDDEMSGVDWALCILCSGIACIIAIIRIIQGKKSGPKMLGISLLFIVIWNIVRFLIVTAQHH